jgi:hypothetical protein
MGFCTRNIRKIHGAGIPDKNGMKRCTKYFYRAAGREKFKGAQQNGVGGGARHSVRAVVGRFCGARGATRPTTADDYPIFYTL